MEDCDICSDRHPTEKCPTLGLSSQDSFITSRARATLPYFLKVLDNEDGTVDIVTTQGLPNKLNLGTFEAVKTTKPLDAQGAFKLQIFIKDDTMPVWLDTADEDKCNWMCLVSTATTAEEQNVMALQVGMEIIYMTTREITGDEALKVWYAPHYAKKISKTNESPPFEHLQTLLQLSRNNTMIFHAYSSPSKELNTKTPKPSRIKMAVSTNIGIYPCSLGTCGLVFPSEEQLERHQLVHQEDDPGTDSKFTILISPRGEPSHDSPRRETLDASTEQLDISTKNDAIEYETLDSKAIKTLVHPRSSFVRHETSKGKAARSCHECDQTFGSLSKLAEHVKQHIVDGMKSGQPLQKKGRPCGPAKKRTMINTSAETERRSSRLKSREREGATKKMDPDFVYQHVKRRKVGSKVENDVQVDIKISDVDKMSDVVIACSSESEEDKNELTEDFSPNSELEDTQYTVVEIIDADEVNDIMSNDATKAEQDVKPLVLLTDFKSQSSIDLGQAINIRPDSSLEVKETQRDPESFPESVMEKALPVTKRSNQYRDPSPKRINIALRPVEIIPTGDRLVAVEPVRESVTVYDDKSNIPSIININDMDVITGEPLSRDRSSEEPRTSTVDSAQGEALLDASNDTYTCTTCGEKRTFTGMTELEQHLFTHVGVKKCDECKKMYNTGTAHECEPAKQNGAPGEPLVPGKEKEKAFECKECGRLFEKHQYLATHLQRHKESTNCEKCKKIFRSEHLLRKHVCPQSNQGIADSAKEFYCEFCGATFLKQKYLVAHMAYHTEEHRCTNCKLAFARKETLMKHWTKCMPEQVAKGLLKVFACEKCPRVFGKEISLENHKKVHQNTFKCSLCDKIFSSQFSLDRHAQECKVKPGTNKDGFSCPECDKTLRNRTLLQRHMRLHSGSHQCVICHTNFSRRDELTRHTLECSAATQFENSGQIKCMICSEIFMDVHAFRVHYETHTHPYKCEACGKLFLRGSALKLHERKCQPVDKSNYVSCEICKKTFKHEKLLVRHKRVHEVKKYACDMCGKSFRRIDYLNDHMCINDKGQITRVKRDIKKKEIAADEPWVCPTCGKTYSTSSNLNKHMLLHGEKKEQCGICKKKFHLLVSVKEHIKYVHAEEPQIKCDICGKRMKSRNSLYGHMKLYHSEVDTLYSCECGKSFRLKGNLLKHRLTHSKVKMFHCQFCRQKFKFPEQLRRHELWHTTGPRYYCDLCDKGYIMEFEIKKHLNTVHGGLTYICSYCNMDCHYFHSMKRHLQRKHFDRPEWQTDTNAFIRALATRTKVIATKEADGTLVKPLKEGHKTTERSQKEIFRCGHCHETFRSKADYSIHFAVVHITTQNYRCCYCLATCGDAESVVLHLETNHADVEAWKSNTANFIQGLLATTDDDECELVGQDSDLQQSLLAQTLAGSISIEPPGNGLLDPEQQGLEQMDLQVLLQGAETLKDEDINNVPGFEATDPVIVAEVQGMSEEGLPNGTTQTVIIKAEGHNIGPDGVLSEELARALQSLTAQGALGESGTTMITITGGESGGENQIPIQLIENQSDLVSSLAEVEPGAELI